MKARELFVAFDPEERTAQLLAELVVKGPAPYTDLDEKEAGPRSLVLERLQHEMNRPIGKGLGRHQIGRSKPNSTGGQSLLSVLVAPGDEAGPLQRSAGVLVR